MSSRIEDGILLIFPVRTVNAAVSSLNYFRKGYL